MCSKYDKQRKLSELAALITGASYPGVSFLGERKEKAKTEAASSSYVEKSQKLKELGRLING